MSPAAAIAVRHDLVAAAIVWNGAEVLIARRRAGDHQGGRWEFPGGKVRAGETIEACVRRELLEEVDLPVDVGPLWRALTHLYPDRRVSIYFHHCVARGGAARPLECAEVRWAPLGELRARDFVEGDRAVLADLVRELGQRGP